ncbi:MAG: aldo/keto reductase [Kiritimatiellia bacterium]|nr:aldo/keto reductase [Kiritimatiellia bacterium]MDP6847826.1 aldo/keto reductase [Kiritimatiellia bacterium]
MDSRFGRRGFLKGAAATAATASIASAAPGNGASSSAIPLRKFGRVGVKLPILGYGGAALPKAWANPLSREDRVKLVRYAHDRGIRYFDTAGNYMESQSIIGEALRDRRKDTFLVSKVETTRETEVRRAVEKSLREMQTDYLDGILIHGTPGLQQMSIPQAKKIHAELVKLKNEKMVRHIGLSAHGYFDKALAMIETGGFDIYMPAFGFIPRGHNQVFSEKMLKLREKSIAKAHELKVALVAMKVVGAGVLGAWSGYIVPEFEKKDIKELPGAAIRWVLNDKRFDMLLIGMRLRHEIDANIKIITTETKLTSKDKTLLASYSKKAMTRKPMKNMKVE